MRSCCREASELPCHICAQEVLERDYRRDLPVPEPPCILKVSGVPVRVFASTGELEGSMSVTPVSMN